MREVCNRRDAKLCVKRTERRVEEKEERQATGML
jgi:hypothetical protein